MRALNCTELDVVSGGDWTIEVDFGIVRGVLEGSESIQDIASGIGNAISDAYWTARDETADLYEWMANGWAYSARFGCY
jgi:hypothetical protein